MNSIDKIYTDKPFYGSRRIKNDLEDYHNIRICREHIQRLMRLMGIEAIYPKKRFNLSQNCSLNKTYPYLLKDYQITKPNQVWGTDITYIKLEKGWAYLAAILDWFSRYVITWKLSSKLESDFCIDNLQNALEINLPQIHNSDQGVQFTDKNYTGILEEKEIKISMDGRGRCMDNIFTERLWRSVKYENVFLKSYHDIMDARMGLKDYFKFYNIQRRHQSLDYQTPEFVYHNR
jgi:putative transposase